MLHVTCRLTAKNWDQLRNPTVFSYLFTVANSPVFVQLCVSMIFVQDTDDNLASESQASFHTVQVNDGDSSGQSDTEEMSDVLKKDPIISKYAKYHVTKKTTQQKSKRKYDFLYICSRYIIR